MTHRFEPLRGSNRHVDRVGDAEIRLEAIEIDRLNSLDPVDLRLLVGIFRMERDGFAEIVQETEWVDGDEFDAWVLILKCDRNKGFLEDWFAKGRGNRSAAPWILSLEWKFSS